MAQGYKDFTAGAVLAAADLEDYNQNQSIMRFASAAARDTALSTVKTEGMMAYLLDVNTVTVYSGSAWSTVGPVHGALTTWTPTVTQTGSVTVTNTYSRYQRIGRMITGWFSLTVTGSGSGTTPVQIGGFPTAAVASIVVGFGQIDDVSAAGTARKFGGYVYMDTTAIMDLRVPASDASGSNADNRFGVRGFSVGLAVGDIILGSFSYEAASDA